jgi:hypothetical protein
MRLDTPGADCSQVVALPTTETGSFHLGRSPFTGERGAP